MMQQAAAVTYVLLMASSLSANKFVLSALGFQFPMVFQGWQTLVGFLIYRSLHALGKVKITSLDMPGYISLFPFFLFFCSSILTGSMALSKIPLVSFLSLSALVPVIVHVFSHYEQRRRLADVKPVGSSSGWNRYQLTASLVIVACNCALLLLEQPSAGHEGYFWCEVHLLCSVGLVLYGRLADARFNAVDRQYYSYIFSLIVLLPASLYLEEAFEALHFQELYQVMFVLGSLACAVSGVALHFHQSRLRADVRFGQLHHLACTLVAASSLGYFKLELASYWSAPLGLVASSALLFIPTFLVPEETAASLAAASSEDAESRAALMSEPV